MKSIKIFNEAGTNAIVKNFQPLPVQWDRCQHYKALEEFYGLKYEWYKAKKRLTLKTLTEDEKVNCKQLMLELENNITRMQHHDDHRLNRLKYQEPYIQEIFKQKQ